MRHHLLLVLAITVGGCTEVCSFEDQVGTFFVEHDDAIDCKFAHRTYADYDLVGAQIVHDCIVDAIAQSRSFVGGYLIYGIDSGANHAYLGSMSGGTLTFSYIMQIPSAYGASTVFRTRCSEIADGAIGQDHIGLDCVGGDLQPVCTPARD